MSKNEPVKNKTGQLLKEGGIFAFGMSEKQHGADLYSNEMKLYRQGDGNYIASGSKYYIGNANEAALVSVFGRIAETDEFVFFVVDPKHDVYLLNKKIHTSGVIPAYVGEFTLENYPITEAQQKDINYMLHLGELFTIVVYAQLVLENARLYQIDDDLVDYIFKLMVTDFSQFALAHLSKFENTPLQEQYLEKMLKRPTINRRQEETIWKRIERSMK